MRLLIILLLLAVPPISALVAISTASPVREVAALLAFLAPGLGGAAAVRLARRWQMPALVHLAGVLLPTVVLGIVVAIGPRAREPVLVVLVFLGINYGLMALVVFWRRGLSGPAIVDYLASWRFLKLAAFIGAGALIFFAVNSYVSTGSNFQPYDKPRLYRVISIGMMILGAVLIGIEYASTAKRTNEYGVREYKSAGSALLHEAMSRVFYAIGALLMLFGALTL